jgi:hypothetical protein
VAGSCGHGNETSGPIKRGKFFDQLMTISFSRRTLFHGVSYLVMREIQVEIVWVVTPYSVGTNGAIHFTLKMEAARSTETLVCCHITTRRHDPEDLNVNLHRR